MKKRNLPDFFLAALRLTDGLPLLLALLPLLLAGCIHQYPEAETATRVTVAFEIGIDASLPLYREVTRSAAGTQGLKRRFIIDAYRDGKVLAEKRILTTGAVEVEEGRYSIPATMQLEAGRYTFAVWCDYAEDESGADLHFVTGDLAQVLLGDTYHPDHTRREAFCGTATADFTDCADMQEVQYVQGTGVQAVEVRQRIDLKRPQAKFVLIGTDTGEFIEQMRKRRKKEAAGGIGNYRARLSYEYYFPTGYDVTGDLLCRSGVGMGFTAPCTVEADEDGECTLAGDFVLEGTDESYTLVALEVLDGDNEVVSRVTGLQIPLKQGHLTIVKGKFLTTMMNAGIGIDPGYDGEFNIIIK